MFVEHEEKLVFDKITENIGSDAAHPLARPQVPHLEPPGGGGQEGEGEPEGGEAPDGPGHAQLVEAGAAEETPQREQPRRGGPAGRHRETQNFVILWKMTR